MKSYDNNSKNSKLTALIIKSAIIEIVVTAIFIFIFATVMFFTESAYNYATVFATAAIAFGSLAAAFYVANKVGSRGFLTGLITGGITFIVVTLISLFLDKGAITQNTLFHFIIIILSSLIGGILGVNKAANKKYI